MKWIIYKHALIADCPHKGWSYIGLTKQLPTKRWKNGEGYKGQIFYEAIQKYGWDNFIHEIIEDNIESLELANEREKYWIAFFHTYTGDKNCRGYNANEGGNSTLALTEESHKKMSEAAKKRYMELSEEEKYKFHAHSRPQTEETKQKISAAHKGIPLSEEHRQHLSAAQKRRSKESFIPKVPKPGKKVKCKETGIIYASQSAAARATGVCLASLRNCLCGKSKTSGGYHWEVLAEGE